MNSVERVKQICKDRKIPISKLERDLGYSNGYISQLRKGVFPANRLVEIASYLNISTDYLMTGEEKEGVETYYLNDEAREMAQFMFENPNYKVLFDASRKVKPEDIQIVKALLDKFSTDN